MSMPMIPGLGGPPMGGPPPMPGQSMGGMNPLLKETAKKPAPKKKTPAGAKNEALAARLSKGGGKK